MSTVKISKETKRKLLKLIRDGDRIPELYLPFLGNDIQFTEQAILGATECENTNFVSQLKEYIDGALEEPEPERERESKRPHKKRKPKQSKTRGKKRKPSINYNPKVQSVYDAIKHLPLRKSKNYAPTGTPFKAFMEEKGIAMESRSKSAGYVHFVQGGAPGLGKRS